VKDREQKMSAGETRKAMMVGATRSRRSQTEIKGPWRIRHRREEL